MRKTSNTRRQRTFWRIETSHSDTSDWPVETFEYATEKEAKRRAWLMVNSGDATVCQVTKMRSYGTEIDELEKDAEGYDISGRFCVDWHTVEQVAEPFWIQKKEEA